jgi:hypothetical protein
MVGIFKAAIEFEANLVYLHASDIPTSLQRLTVLKSKTLSVFSLNTGSKNFHEIFIESGSTKEVLKTNFANFVLKI